MTLSFDILAGNNANWGFDAFSLAGEPPTVPTLSAGTAAAHQRISSENTWTTASATTPALSLRGFSASQRSIADPNLAGNDNDENISPMKNDSLCVTLQASDPAARAFDSNLYVASLPDWFTDADLHELFKRFGPILSAKVMCHKGTHHCKGYGFVLFQRVDDAAMARSEMIGHVVGGSRIQVRRARSAASAPLGDCAPSAAAAVGVGAGAALVEPPRAALQSPPGSGSLNVSPHFIPANPQPFPSLYSATPTYLVANGGSNQPRHPAQTMLVAIPSGRGVVQGPDNVVYMVLTSPQMPAANVIF
ncbi:RNA-binding protein 5-like protein [Leptomonas pyrrhocoris]|uniref:RNA-binding protein 5-like protein n=1 Tax=Leptomonas pyrrhocoris TaxID=157538 RepID=A0A0M9FWC6_LEPPY|nr:RNA-binding protein 5-like protein [Leptomonas pyrrhocoris]KPA77430.1 RNA-binding protein 5-like protein [Leptomonas pyrrhocoris]|eukprot:XP_015655869.1 RNA-binding protein 5-like protein [Leptomonas pyrrhocoris]